MTAEAKRRAIVWDTIERLAFMPDNRQKWLSIYERTLHSLWQLQAADVPIQRLSGFEAVFLNVACEYSVEAADKYSVRIVNAGAAAPFRWCVHADPAFYSRAASYATREKFPHQDREKHLRTDVECVLEGMIFHPRTHAHGDALGFASTFDGNGLSLSTHEVRLCGGVENAFVFLTHLRYQFCLLCDEVRNQERTRLINLFTAAINDRHVVIPPAALFQLTR